MDRLVDILLLGLPLIVLPLLLGLAAVIRLLAREGRGRTPRHSRVLGAINLAMMAPLGLLGWSAEGGDLRWSFWFAALVFAFLGLLGLLLPRRFAD